MTFYLYNLLLLLLAPAIAGFIAYRVFVSGKSRESWRQQFGLVRLPGNVPKSDRFWIHAVSVGESVASAAVVGEIKKQLPECGLIVSTTTKTGQEMARKSVKDADALLYFPFDLLPAVWWSLRAVEPVVFASTDTEIWPNFLHVARRFGVRTAMINGTVSDRTLRGAKKAPWLYRWAMSNIDRFCMQSEADAQRVVSLGADPKRVIVTGNCKADQADEPLTFDEKDELRLRYKLPQEARVFVAGSTNPGEDEPVIDAFLHARREHSALRLVIAPRQIERREDIADLAHSRGLSAGFRSESEHLVGKEDVLILDTFGELAKVYALADVSFVGGSLIPRGCHSILQPIAQGKPVFFGPYTFKAKDLVAQAKAAGVGFEILSGDALGRELALMLRDRTRLEDIRLRCESMMLSNKGAARRTAEALIALREEATAARGGCDDSAGVS